MTKIERNEILERVKSLNPVDAKELLNHLVRILIEDIEWQEERAKYYNEKGNFGWAIAKEETVFNEELKLSFVQGWVGNDF